MIYKMVNNLRGKDVRAKQEGEISDIKSSSTTTTTSGSRQWAGFKNPRIVRVSRSFGGKDRHSKVCTIRGLKDRRIRLSVPSAIQLYDLQDRLGLNQPSKVVDWLLDNTKDDIDKLPPLQMPSGDFTQFYHHHHHHHHQQTLAPHHELYTPQSNSLSPFFDINSQFMTDGRIQFFGKEGLYKINNDNPDEDSHMVASRKSKLYLATTSLDAAADSREKHKEVINIENLVDDKWNVPDINYEGCSDHRVISCNIPQLSAQNFLPLVNQLSFPSIISNTAALPYTREPPSLSLSQFGSQVQLFPSQLLQSQSYTHSAAANSVLHPNLAQSTPPQFLFYPPAVTTPLFPPQYHSHMSTTTNNSSIEDDPRPANHFPFMSSSGSQNVIIPNSDIVSPFHSINPFSCVNTKENLQKNEDTTK